jgi:hypothetical protein
MASSSHHNDVTADHKDGQAQNPNDPVALSLSKILIDVDSCLANDVSKAQPSKNSVPALLTAIDPNHHRQDSHNHVLKFAGITDGNDEGIQRLEQGLK